MAKSFVGRFGTDAANGADVTIDLTALTGGSNTAPSEGDIVFAYGACGGGGSPGFPGDWTPLNSGLNSDSSRRLVIAYKEMGATPDTSVLFTSDGDASTSSFGGCIVFRAAALDSATPTVSTGSSANPDPAAIVPSEADSAVVVIAISTNADISKTPSTGYTELFDGSESVGNPDTNDVGTYAEWLDGLAASSQDPSAIGTWSSGSWRCVTFALNNPSSGAEFALSKTLGALTSSAQATVDITASVSKTLGALTSSSAATVDIDASLTKTLGAITLSSELSAGMAAEFSLAKTLGAATVLATATVDVTASLSKTLGAATLAAEAQATSAGEFALARTLGAVTVASAAAVDIEAMVSKALADLTAAATATVGGGAVIGAPRVRGFIKNIGRMMR